MILITSCATNKKVDVVDTNKAFISLSKGKCLGSCPVYDLWIFKDGKVVYSGLENVEKKGIHETKISLEQINELCKLVKKASDVEAGDIRGRDIPLSILKFKDKRIVYQSLKIKGNLLIINNLINNIVIGI